LNPFRFLGRLILFAFVTVLLAVGGFLWLLHKLGVHA
jgi:hypothetical protein